MLKPTTTKLEKNSEFTYGLHTPSLARLVADNRATIMDPPDVTGILGQLDNAVMGSVRSLNNEFQLFRQGIAYGLPFKILDTGEVVFLVYCRTKKNNEQQLSQKLSLAPGGHIERDDLNYHILQDEDRDPILTPAIDLLTTMRANLIRELREEVIFHSEEVGGNVNYKIGTGAQPIGFVMDSIPEDNKYVGNIHFGAIYAIPVPNNDTTFVMPEECNDAVGWKSAVELIDHITGASSIDESVIDVEFEPWSRMIIERIGEVVGMIKAVFPK